MKELTLNEGPQYDFVQSPARYAAYIGGVGSGKTYAGIVRGLRYALQPVEKGRRPPRGVIAAASFRSLEDVVEPLFWEITEGTGLVRTESKSKKTVTLENGAQILFRSLDEPNRLRGLELAWFFIDEGREVDQDSWKVLVGRLRQKGVQHSGWVASTPNGFDWMYYLFHESSNKKHPQAVWFNAATMDNAHNLAPEYIPDLFASYEGKFARQEIYGDFVGAMEGAVFTEWQPEMMHEVEYNPELPLYSFWDFGIGEIGVVVFAQIEYKPKVVPSGETWHVPHIYFVGTIEAKNWAPARWVQAFNEYCDAHYDGRKPDRNIGDPAGLQTQTSSGTSTIKALASHGLRVIPAPKRPIDEGIFLLDNMMAGGRVQVDKRTSERLGEAFASHHWKTDAGGNRVGTTPVHDWTSHYADACRYGALVLLSHTVRRSPAPAPKPLEPGMAGYITKQILTPKKHYWLGDTEPDLDWGPALPVRSS